MSATLDTGITLPEEGGDSQVWDNKLNANWTLMDIMVRQQIALFNDQDPIGTVKQIPTSAPLPTGWEEIPNSSGRTLVSSEQAISDGETGGSVGWAVDFPGTEPAGGHQHSSAGSHQHSAAGGHQHGGVGGHRHDGQDRYWTFDTSLSVAQLPNFSLAVLNGNNVITNENTGNLLGNFSGDAVNFYLKNITQTASIGSGQGHGHDMTHVHVSDGAHNHPAVSDHQHGAAGSHQHGSVGDHSHTQKTPYWMCEGRWIRKARLLTLSDFKAQTPVSA